jgi:hypothetical protein
MLQIVLEHPVAPLLVAPGVQTIQFLFLFDMPDERNSQENRIEFDMTGMSCGQESRMCLHEWREARSS